ncbi:hypothetical protein CW304_26885 [Bacillus sp. UFRGS-B20]|nr:hypothetical protein CW304_26885 [Bacillus sp. UFRGS-B20]
MLIQCLIIFWRTYVCLVCFVAVQYTCGIIIAVNYYNMVPQHTIHQRFYTPFCCPLETSYF